jgi:uncharacterized protein (DUF488 family)
MSSHQPLKLWTIGHSTRSSDEFIQLLQGNAIELLVDVRRFPGSRKHPQFNSEALAESLAAAGIGYRLMKDLGGRRTGRPDSQNTAWRNASFRAYADYMESPEFESAIAELMKDAAARRTAIMCSEAVWWSCHRSLIADYLKVRGVEVWHILSPTKVDLHPYTSAATVVDGHLSYHGPEVKSDAQLKLFSAPQD